MISQAFNLRASGKPRLLILSHVLPFPRSGGQQQRVYYTLKCAAREFHVTFATVEGQLDSTTIERELSSLCDDVLFVSRWRPSMAGRLWHRAAADGYALATGLKRSNYYIGRVQFTPRHVEAALGDRHFDGVLFEYWHAAACTSVFRRRNIPTILDMHDVLWQAYARQLHAHRLIPTRCKPWLVDRYKRAEEDAWQRFDALVAINRDEERYVRARVPGARVFHTPMGTDLQLWPSSWKPSLPPRVAYYGSLASAHNRTDALRCARQIMPLIWRRVPDAELWIVGAHPPESIKRLPDGDRRIHVTGFVSDVQPLLATMQVVLCPWSGTYGFRSRLIEVMALGIPTVASPEAVSGMELEPDRGLLLGSSDTDLAEFALRVIADATYAREQSALAREQVEHRFSLGDTYERLMADLGRWLRLRGRWPAAAAPPREVRSGGVMVPGSNATAGTDREPGTRATAPVPGVRARDGVQRGARRRSRVGGPRHSGGRPRN